MTKPQVTAVGRLLKAKPGQKQVYKVISVKPDGTVKTVVSQQLG